MKETIRTRIIKITLNDGSILFYPQSKKSFFSRWKYICSLADMVNYVDSFTAFDLTDYPRYSAINLVTEQKAREVQKAFLAQNKRMIDGKINKIEIVK